MARRTLPLVVIRGLIFQVTFLAIGRACRRMVENRIRPIRRAVAQRALATKVIGWFIIEMAVAAINSAHCLVVKSRIGPTNRGMT